MTTSHTTFRRRVRRCALALMVSATLVPASSALAQGNTPADSPGMPGSPQTPRPVGDAPADYGKPGSPQTPPPVASPTQEASGFDWTSAAIGAGAGGVLIVISLVGATAAPRPRLRRVRA